MIKSRKFYYSILLLIFTVCISISSHVYAQERFQLLFTDSGVTYKIDSSRFNITNKDGWSFIDSWLLFEYDSNAVAEKIDQRKKDGWSIKGFDNLDHSLSHWTFKVNKDIQIFLDISQCIYYDHNGKVLDSWTDDIPKWSGVIPNSIGEGIFFSELNYVMVNTQKPKE
ncbi:MAG: hypothetical protein GX451_10495 [Acholeplasmataceae bacterium]|nr:hypothetical protein [Acholeplasmataceae bacterium]